MSEHSARRRRISFGEMLALRITLRKIDAHLALATDTKSMAEIKNHLSIITSLLNMAHELIEPNETEK